MAAIDAVWVGYPKSYTPGRRRPVQFVTLHYTAGSEGDNTAEAGASYDKRRTDGTSTHYFTDSAGLPIWEVPLGDRAHTARFHGNEIGVHIEICGTRQTRAQWLDAVSTRTLRTTAKLVAQLCRQLGLPVRRLSTAETRAAYYAAEGKRPKGINDHNACTYAFPEDDGTHEDVGAEFPWDVFLGWVQGYYDEEGGDMALTDEDALKVAQTVWSVAYGRDERRRTTQQALWDTMNASAATLAAVNKMGADVAAIKAALEAAGGDPDNAPIMVALEQLSQDVAALAAQVAALPNAVADEQAQRLAE